MRSAEADHENGGHARRKNVEGKISVERCLLVHGCMLEWNDLIALDRVESPCSSVAVIEQQLDPGVLIPRGCELSDRLEHVVA
jgi:hypothetical protein